MKKGKETGVKKNKKISMQLLCVLVPMIALFIIIVAAILFVNAKSIITKQGMSRLEKESEANAKDISGIMEGIKGYYNGLGDLMETAAYKSDKDIKKALQPGMKEYPGVVNDVYVAFPDKTFIDGGEWVPDADYDPTTRGWYQTGSTADSIIFGTPDIDMDTKEAVVNGIRTIKFLDGRKGVLSTDIFLKSISSAVGAYAPLGTGKSMLFAGPKIIGSPVEELLGANAEELTDNQFVQDLYKDVAAGKIDQSYALKGDDGSTYMVSLENISGTDWILASYVKKSDVLKEMNDLTLITVILVVVMLIVSTVIILYLISRMVTKPVQNLTNTITKIADGDFTIDIEKGGENEIGVMNNRMYDYVKRMRSTLGEMKQVTQSLHEEADNSMNAASSMSQQADEQSTSMDRIRDAMADVSQSVSTLAANSANLAQAVGGVTEQGEHAKEIMDELLESAKQGQHDMNNVRENMRTISTSMTEMNNIVSAVDQAAQKINSIVEMINSISSQTNLLSLNASIEAARAGEAGKGFAVVATEIGKLAEDSANATTEIGEIIKDITEQVASLSKHSETSMHDIENSSKAVSMTGENFAKIFTSLDRAGTTVEDMVEKMADVSDIAASVAAIAEEQSASTQEVAATVETVAYSAQSVADESRNVDKGASTVAESSVRIGGFVDSFTI